jgi:hypothetical protein
MKNKKHEATINAEARLTSNNMRQTWTIKKHEANISMEATT